MVTALFIMRREIRFIIFMSTIPCICDRSLSGLPALTHNLFSNERIYVGVGDSIARRTFEHVEGDLALLTATNDFDLATRRIRLGHGDRDRRRSDGSGRREGRGRDGEFAAVRVAA